jgi:hypothetical protein
MQGGAHRHHGAETLREPDRSLLVPLPVDFLHQRRSGFPHPDGAWIASLFQRLDAALKGAFECGPVFYRRGGFGLRTSDIAAIATDRVGFCFCGFALGCAGDFRRCIDRTRCGLFAALARRFPLTSLCLFSAQDFHALAFDKAGFVAADRQAFTRGCFPDALAKFGRSLDIDLLPAIMTGELDETGNRLAIFAAGHDPLLRDFQAGAAVSPPMNMPIRRSPSAGPSMTRI